MMGTLGAWMGTLEACFRCGATPKVLIPLLVSDPDLEGIKPTMRAFCTGCAMLELGIVDKPSEGEGGGDSEDK